MEHVLVYVLQLVQILVKADAEQLVLDVPDVLDVEAVVLIVVGDAQGHVKDALVDVVQLVEIAVVIVVVVIVVIAVVEDAVAIVVVNVKALVLEDATQFVRRIA